nr:hypothetical protein CPGR_03876 [Mycolicibacterium malmesburyense]
MNRVTRAAAGAVLAGSLGMSLFAVGTAAANAAPPGLGGLAAQGPGWGPGPFPPGPGPIGPGGPWGGGPGPGPGGAWGGGPGWGAPPPPSPAPIGWGGGWNQPCISGPLGFLQFCP